MNTNILYKTPLQLRQEQFTKAFKQYELKKQLTNFQNNLKNNLLYGHNNKVLNCGMMLGNMNTGAYRGVAGWDYEEDFTGCTTNTCDGTYPSSDTGVVFVDTTNNEIDYSFVRDASNNSITKDLNGVLGGNLSDTAWVLRTHNITITTKTSGIVFNNGMYSAPYTSGVTTAQDSMLNMWGDSSANRLFDQITTDGAAIVRKAGVTSYSLSTAYFEELIRTSSTTGTLKVFTNVDFSTGQVGATINITPASTSDTYRYLGLKGDMAAGSTESLIGTLNKYQVANGVTVAP